MKGFMRTQRLKCPVCGALTGKIPCNMGNQIVKCTICCNFMEYKFRTESVDKTNEPEKKTSSGSILF